MKRKNSRRTYLSLLLTGLLVVSTVTLGGAALSFAKSSPTVTDGNWTANRADTGRTGATTGTGPSGPYAGTDWTINPDGRPSGAVVEGDTVYLGVETFAEYNRRNGKVVAYDAQTGAVRWNRTELGGVDESPTFANGTVYVTADGVTGTDNILNESGTPGLFALNADTGETKWRNNATKTWTGTPTVVGGTVYAHSGTTIYAIDAETGQTTDSFELDSDGDESPNVSVYNSIEGYAVVGDTAYLSVHKRTTTRTKVDGDWQYNSTDVGKLIALNTSDWSREWTNDIDSIPSGLAVTNGAVYWTVQPNEVYSFAADDSTQRWHKRSTTASMTANRIPSPHPQS
jgi:outer membrane protein assembly factor BamB